MHDRVLLPSNRHPYVLFETWKKGRYGEIRKAARGVSQSACAGSLITVWPSRPEVYNIIMFLADNSSMTIVLNCTIPAIVQNYFLKTVLALQGSNFRSQKNSRERSYTRISLREMTKLTSGKHTIWCQCNPHMCWPSNICNVVQILNAGQSKDFKQADEYGVKDWCDSQNS